MLTRLLIYGLDLLHLRLGVLDRVVEDGALLIFLRLRLVDMSGLLLEARAHVLGISDLELPILICVAEAFFLAAVQLKIVS